MTQLDHSEHDAANYAEKEDRRLELVATVLLGLGAVLIAWGTYQSAWYDGQKGTELTNSVLATTQSVDAFQVADTTRALDQILFVEMLASGVCSDSGQRAVCEQFTDTLSNEGREEIAAWLSGDSSSIFNAKRRYLRGGNALIEDAQQYFESAQQADDTSSSYSQSVAFVSISLFFAGISLVISRSNLRKGLLALAALFVVGPLIFMATLPIA
jgi:hypothetical protein